MYFKCLDAVNGKVDEDFYTSGAWVVEKARAFVGIITTLGPHTPQRGALSAGS